MGGSVRGRGRRRRRVERRCGSWSFATVLAAAVPLTIVPEDAIPYGTPDALDAPVVGVSAVAVGSPTWWDLATAAALVAARGGSTGRLEPRRGRARPALARTGDGAVRGRAVPGRCHARARVRPGLQGRLTGVSTRPDGHRWSRAWRSCTARCRTSRASSGSRACFRMTSPRASPRSMTGRTWSRSGSLESTRRPRSPGGAGSEVVQERQVDPGAGQSCCELDDPRSCGRARVRGAGRRCRPCRRGGSRVRHPPRSRAGDDRCAVGGRLAPR